VTVARAAAVAEVFARAQRVAEDAVFNMCAII
jgi:hypothetical protein